MRIGLIAGNGQFPFYFARCAKERGYEVVAAGLKGETDPALADEVSSLRWVSIGAVSAIIELFKQERITEAVMAGQVKHRKLYWKLFLDTRAVRILRSIPDRRTDSILRAVAQEFEREGIRLLPSTLFLDRFMPGAGALGACAPTEEETRDISFGFRIAKELSRLDIGQTVVVKDRAVVAVEALEGTDECIKRGGAIAAHGSDASAIVVVKVAKPRQDVRFDVPVIGMGTIQTLRSVGGRVIAFESGKTLVMDQPQIIEAADAATICLVGIDSAVAEQRESSQTLSCTSERHTP